MDRMASKMGELACLDASQVAAIIFGTIFATLALCAGCALILWYLLLANRNHSFAKKVPGLEKFLATGLPRMRRGSGTKSVDVNAAKDGKQHAKSAAVISTTTTKVIVEQQPEKQKIKPCSREHDEIDATPKRNQEGETAPQTPQKSSPTAVEASAAAHSGSMEEISLEDTTPDDIRLIKRVASKLSQSEGSLVYRAGGTTSTAESAADVFDDPETDNKTNDITTTATPTCNRSTSGQHSPSDDSDVALSPEQRVALNANRLRLEAERQQMRQLGIL